MADPTALPGPISAADAKALVDARCSRQDMQALRASPDGDAMFEAIVNIMVDESQRLDRTVSARHLIQRASDVNPTASGAIKATVSLLIQRSAANFGGASLAYAVTIPKGTVVPTSDGHLFALDADLTFAAGELGPKSMTATALVAGAASTSAEQMITSFQPFVGQNAGSGTVAVVAGATVLTRTDGDRLLPIHTGAYILVGPSGAQVYARVLSVALDGSSATIAPVAALASGAVSWTAVEWAGLGFTVTQPSATTQGADDDLDALGRELGRQRQTGESDASLTRALINLTNAISPIALVSACNRILGSLGPVTLYEMASSYVDQQAASGIGAVAWPGVVADMTPCDVSPDALFATGPNTAPYGMSFVGGPNAYFVLRWDNYTLGETGGCAYADDTGSSTADPPSAAVTAGTSPAGFPRGMAADVSPADGGPFGAAAVRRAIAAQIKKIKGAGVGWAFYPRSLPAP